MKTMIKLMVVASLVFGSYIYASAQIYVNVRPVEPKVVVERPVQPSPEHIWVGAEWVPDGPHYKYVAAHWERPPHHGARWHGGHWEHDNARGHYWVAGGWK